MYAITRLPVLALALLLGSQAPVAQASDATVVTIELTNFSFAPANLSLVHGQNYRLRLVNRASGGHNFKAPGFFAASTIAPESASRIASGGVEVHGHETIELDVTPLRPGHYDLKCTHFLHGVMGMKGEITVS